jgi:hypothetical protein
MMNKQEKREENKKLLIRIPLATYQDWYQETLEKYFKAKNSGNSTMLSIANGGLIALDLLRMFGTVVIDDF